MPRRPDPETGLIPVDEPVSPVFATQPMDYPVLAEPVEVPQHVRRSRRMVEQAWMPRDRIVAGVQMDMMRQQVGLYITRCDANGNTAVLVPSWRIISPGEASGEPPLYLDETDSRHLAESLEAVTGRRDRAREWQSRYEEVRSELRSTSNQLEQARDRADDLADQVAFLRRQVAFLNRELRDCNRERRGEPVAPEAPATEFAG